LNAWRFWPDAAGDGNRAIFAGVVGRLYLRESGTTEPYLELDLGVSSLSRTTSGAGGTARDHAALVAAARSAIGIDFWIGSHARVGPSFAYTRYAPRGAERCTALGCVPLDAQRTNLPLNLLSLAISFTFGAGDPL
jgi:hypothetical protein